MVAGAFSVASRVASLLARCAFILVMKRPGQITFVEMCLGEKGLRSA
jgi:hypothetical protein